MEHGAWSMERLGDFAKGRLFEGATLRIAGIISHPVARSLRRMVAWLKIAWGIVEGEE